MATCLLPERTWTPLAFRSRKKALGLLVAPGGEQAGGVRGRRAEERLGDADLPFHLGSIRSLIPLGRSASATSLVLTIRIRPGPRSRTRFRPWP